jgi:hypothetical protein
VSEETKRAILEKALAKIGPESLVARLNTPMAQIHILGAIDETLPYGRSK